MKLDETLKVIVSNPKLDHFSTVEIRTAYMILNTECTMSASESRRFVYAELKKLVNKGWLKKNTSKKKGLISYVKTELFNLKPRIVTSSVNDNENKLVAHTLFENMQELNCRLQDYKNDLLEGLGEAEEYRTLRNEFPQMHDELQPKYNSIREKNSRLLGKIKAIETLINKRAEL
ncbi:hypothetical protein [Colwellia sp. Arc7-D]|uniref:hypothetical protein n=1 Tax=Colwellia sp. Arc7-D TaxID=2161872 RepID=UPI000D3D3345|nr:hypothetical protein [Colwellia sp. Arc7-D]AWB57860.1 hypothetical protein DBO93_09935 [Colwellia sp. Arc7-D]